MAVDLLFGVTGPYVAPSGGSVALLFGDDTGVAGAVTETRLSLRLRLAAALTVRAARLAPGGPTRLPYVPATPAPADRSAAAWGALAGEGRQTAARAPWGDAAVAPLGRADRLAWGAAAPRQDRAQTRWADAGPARSGARLPWGVASPRQARAEARWQAARPQPESLVAPWQAARPRLKALVAPWGPARLFPAPNRPLPRDPLEYGLVPRNRRVDLHFCVPLPASLDLVFGRENCITQPRVPDGLAIDSRSSYVATHSITAHRLPDLTPIPLDSFSLSADESNFGWSLSATGPEQIRALLEPAPGGVPKELRLVVDGMTWVFAVLGVRRQRSFGRDDTVITARSVTALLADPFMPTTAWLNSVPMTAQQLVDEALLFTDVTLDWQVTDWLVPAGAWSFAGTPLAAAQSVANAIGALVQSHREDPQLIVAPRYPAMPWEWAGVVPDVTLAFDAVETEGYERTDRPAYEGVYVSGQAQGVLALVKRAGTGPALTIPLVTDPLITALEAAEQRGRALLGAAGPQAKVDLLLPVLTGPSEPGVIDVGKFVRVLDPAGAWTGLVRSVSVRYDRPVLDQTITVERHL